jgi:hypothetical protein
MVNSKRVWPSFPIQIVIYPLLNDKHANKYAKQLEDILVHCTNLKRHDPKEMVKNHYRMVRYSKSYYHEECPLNIIFHGVENVEEVILRIE